MRVLLIIILSGLMARLWVAWQPVAELTWRVTSDDAYYYFKLAQYLGAGAGATFDGINPTNGFHALYAVLLVPIFQVAGADIGLGVHLALTLIALLGAVAAWPIFLLGKSVHSAQAGLIGAAMYVLNPWTIMLTMTAVESAVYVFCFACTAAAYVAWRAGSQSLRGLAVVGMLAGLTVMGRSEGGLLLFGVLLDVAWGVRTDRQRAITRMVVLGVMAVLVCLPWAIWSSALFGTPLQISAAAIMLHNNVGAPPDLAARINWYLMQISEILPQYVSRLVLFSLPMVLAVCVFWLWPVLLKRLPWRAGWLAARPLGFLLLPFLLISGYYTLVLRHQQHWYFNALVLILTLLMMPIVAAWIAEARTSVSRHVSKIAIPISMLVMVAGVSMMWQSGVYPAQAWAYPAAQQIAASPVRDARFASTDSGILGFFCGCTLVNLDGVMNNAAVAHYRVHGISYRSIIAFARLQQVQYLVMGSGAAVLTIGETQLSQYRAPDGRTFPFYHLDPPAP